MICCLLIKLLAMSPLGNLGKVGHMWPCILLHSLVHCQGMLVISQPLRIVCLTLWSWTRSRTLKTMVFRGSLIRLRTSDATESMKRPIAISLSVIGISVRVIVCKMGAEFETIRSGETRRPTAPEMLFQSVVLLCWRD